MPIDLVIDEREGGPKDGDSNNNANRSTADSTSHTDGASTPDMVSSSALSLLQLGWQEKTHFESPNCD